MSLITFLTDNRTLDASLSVLTGGENSQFPLSNIQHAHTTKVFRSTSNTSEILIDLKATQMIDAFAMVGSTTEGIGVTTVTIYGSATTDFTGSTPRVVTLSPEHNFGFKLFNAGNSFRFWKVKLTNTAGYCELSNIYLGSKTQLADNNLSRDTFLYKQEDQAKITSNLYGQRFIDKTNTLMSLSGVIKLCTVSEFETLNALYTAHGEAEPLWFLLDPDGCMATGSEFLFSGYFYFDKAFTWKSSGPSLYDVGINLGEAV